MSIFRDVCYAFILVCMVSLSYSAQPSRRGFLVLDGGYFYQTSLTETAGSLAFAKPPVTKARFWLTVIRNRLDAQGAGQGNESASITPLNVRLDPSASSRAKKEDVETDCPPVPEWHKSADAIGIDSPQPKEGTTYALEIPTGFERISSEAAHQELKTLIKAELAQRVPDNGVSAESMNNELKVSAKFVNGDQSLWYASSSDYGSAFFTIFYSPGRNAPQTKLATFEFVISCAD